MLIDLIFDVGVNDGTDSAYYLSRAKRVVGIEASPVAVEKLQNKFAREIAEHRYVLLNIGIASTEDEFEFWVCDDHPEWSSFDPQIASRNNSRHHAVAVKTRLFSAIIAEHGVPDYAKIDIEGHDRCRLEALRPEIAPHYISVEMSHASGDIDIELLVALGYREFKIISQHTMTQPLPLLYPASYALPVRLKAYFRRADRRVRGVVRDGDWAFPSGSSGAFGEMTAGAWGSANRALKTWRVLRDLDRKYEAQGLADWFDIHARR